MNGEISRMNFARPSQEKMSLMGIILITGISLILRWILILHGGQFFFPDEERYLQSRVIATDLLEGKPLAAMTDAVQTADHLGYKVIGTIPALFEIWLGQNPVLPAIFFSFFSALNIVLVWLIALRAGSDAREATFAAIFLALSNVFFYYTRHLLPYDAAIAFGLLSLYAGIKTNPKLVDSVTCGFLAFMAFITYNGYWTWVAFTLAAHIFFHSLTASRIIKRGFGYLLGLIIPMILLLGIGAYFGSNLWSSYVSFSMKIHQGVYSEGWNLPFKYLWHAEHGLLFAWLGFTFLVIILIYILHPKRIYLWLSGLAFIYGSLVIFSAGLELFVVYGRLARQMVPFLALISAFSLRILEERLDYGRLITTMVICLGVIQAGYNFRQPLEQRFPLDFAAEAQAKFPDFQMTGGNMRYTSPPVYTIGPYRAVYVKYIYPAPEPIPPIHGELLMSAVHPLSFKPYQYEGFTPDQRVALRSTEISMRLYKIK